MFEEGGGWWETLSHLTDLEASSRLLGYLWGDCERRGSNDVLSDVWLQWPRGGSGLVKTELAASTPAIDSRPCSLSLARALSLFGMDGGVIPGKREEEPLEEKKRKTIKRTFMSPAIHSVYFSFFDSPAGSQKSENLRFPTIVLLRLQFV